MAATQGPLSLPPPSPPWSRTATAYPGSVVAGERFAALFPFGPGTKLLGAARAAQPNPHPAAKATVPRLAPATAQGVLPSMGKAEAHLNWLKVASSGILASIKAAAAATGGSA